MNQQKSLESNWVKGVVSILFFLVVVPVPAQALCVDSESCGILGGIFLSMLTVPICLLALFFAIWPKTRKSLQAIAVLPGLMAGITLYLMVIQAQRIDLMLIPLIHLGIMALMIFLGRIGSSRKEVIPGPYGGQEQQDVS